jgi:hypothetical protein
VGDECGAHERHEEPDVHIAVAVLAHQNDHHRVQGDADQEGATHRGSLGSCQDQRDIERHHDRRLDEDEVHAKRGQKWDSDVRGDRIEDDDDLEPERWPVEPAGFIRVPTFRAGVEHDAPVIDVEW